MIIFLFSVLEDQTASDHLKMYIFFIHLEKISKVTLLGTKRIAMTGNTKKIETAIILCLIPQPNTENGLGLAHMSRWWSVN